MKKIILVCLIGLSQIGFAQSSEEIKNRVLTIKKWYGEIQTIGLKNCFQINKVEKDEIDKNDIREFNQIIKKCNLNNDYQLMQGEFSGLGYGCNLCIYKKNDKVFFVFFEMNAEGPGPSAYEGRFYFNDNEVLVKELSKEMDYQGKGSNIEIKDKLGKKLIEVFEDDRFFKQVYLYEFIKE